MATCKLPNPNVHSYTGTEWRLKDTTDGRQVWEYIGDDPAAVKDRVAELKRAVEDSLRRSAERPTTASEAVRKGIEHYATEQRSDGHWSGDYGGPMFLLPGLVFVTYITGIGLPDAHRREIIKYLSNHQNSDGGWGLHIEDHSTVYGTVMSYIALRVLGLARDDPVVVQARGFIHKHGGAVGIPSWGKFWMCVLGVFKWEGMNPVPPELWWLPSWLPMHPSKMWCHCRVVYLPMAYIYGRRGQCKETPLIRELREELFVQPWHTINWTRTRRTCAAVDLYFKPSRVYTTLIEVLNVYEKVHSRWARSRALATALDHIKYEDMVTKHICIGPVNKVLNMLSVWFAEGDSPDFRKHCDRLWDYLWVSDDGMKMQGYNGSQLWDTAFASQAIMESNMTEEFKDVLQKCYNYIDVSQVIEEVPTPAKYFRHISKGAWPFSTRDHGWPISDCTSEAVKAMLKLHKLPYNPGFPAERMYEGINIILSMQNKGSGGWATYELTRAGKWMELMNPSEVFGDIMIDYPYVECTSACVTALCSFRQQYPHHRTAEINHAIRRGVQCIKDLQRKDGSWYGSWAVCFCYGTWFGVEGLIAAGESPSSAPVRRACEFLISKQLKDGGWGESYLSSATKEYHHHPHGGLVVNTGWALLALLRANYPDPAPLHRAAQFLMSRQLPDGNWAQEAVSGVFNANCMITYANYKNIFPIWALSRYANRFPSTASRL